VTSDINVSAHHCSQGQESREEAKAFTETFCPFNMVLGFQHVPRTKQNESVLVHKVSSLSAGAGRGTSRGGQDTPLPSLRPWVCRGAIKSRAEARRVLHLRPGWSPFQRESCPVSGWTSALSSARASQVVLTEVQTTLRTQLRHPGGAVEGIYSH
jgi:hypothetical protein